MRFRTLSIGLLILVAQAAPAQEVTVKGTVVDADGKPAANVEVANFWIGKGSVMTAYNGVTTDSAGKFAVKVPEWMPEPALMAIAADRKTGAITSLKPKESTDVPPMKLSPLVKVSGQFECKDVGRKPKWTNVYMNTLKNSRLLQCDSNQGEFAFLLPAGKYSFHGYGQDVRGVRREIEVLADKPLFDLGTIDLPATEIAKHVGKAPPQWFVKDARGLKKEVTLADFKGKWVLVDFWGHWCGPCVQQMASLIDLYEDHADHRDQFVIIAYHDSSVPTFAEMDEKTKQTKASVWSGRDLPFPILLDDDHKTAKAHSIEHWPTTILIDPEGKLVGEVDSSELEAKLPKLPAGVKAARALDRGIAYGFEDPKLTDAMQIFTIMTRVPIQFDDSALEAAKIDKNAIVPFTMTGRLTLRSFLNLVLRPYGLTYKSDADGIVIAPGAIGEPSAAQKTCAEHINKDVLDKPLDFDLKDKTLAEIAKYFEAKTQENFVLDPAARRAGTLDPKTKLSGSSKDAPLRDGLKKLLDPMKLTFVVRDEVVVILPK